MDFQDHEGTTVTSGPHTSPPPPPRPFPAPIPPAPPVLPDPLHDQFPELRVEGTPELPAGIHSYMKSFMDKDQLGEKFAGYPTLFVSPSLDAGYAPLKGLSKETDRLLS